MSDKPKTFEEKLNQLTTKASQYAGKYFTIVEYAENKGIRFVLEEFWNTATEATRSEYEDKIKAMQAEIDRLEKTLSDIANHDTLNGEKYNNYTEAYFGVVRLAERNLSRQSSATKIYKELNQRGEDE